MTGLVGWLATAVPLTTFGRQVYGQLRAGITKHLSCRLFVGQTAASIAFVIYGWLLGNRVFVVANALMLATAVLSEFVWSPIATDRPPYPGDAGDGFHV